MILWVRPQNGVKMTIGPDGQREYEGAFTVRSNVPNEQKVNILLCGMLPVYGYSPYPDDYAAICNYIHPEQNKTSPHHWEVQVRWSTHQIGNPQDRQKPPDQRRPVWSYKFSPLQKYFPADYDGLAYKDSAGTPFDPPPARAIWMDEITIERYETSLNRQQDRSYLNASNTDAWQGADPGEALIQNIATAELFEQGAYWFKRTFTVLVCPRVTVDGSFAPIAGAGGQPFVGAFDYDCVIDAGPRQLDANGAPQPIVGAAGVVDGRGQRLDGRGHVLTPATANNVYLRFRNTQRAAFAPLKLVPPY
jgi:hypothetical protein